MMALAERMHVRGKCRLTPVDSLAGLLMALVGCHSTSTAPQNPAVIACVRIAIVQAPDGTTATAWVSPIVGLRCRVPK